MNDLLSLGILYVLGIFVLIYFFTVLPARKKHRRVQAMHAAVKEGDEIVTIGGVIAQVLSRDGTELVLKLNDAGTTMKIVVYAVQSIRKSRTE